MRWNSRAVPQTMLNRRRFAPSWHSLLTDRWAFGLRAERAVDLDAALRPSERQGGVDLPVTVPAGKTVVSTAPRLAGDRGRQVHLHVGRAAADGHVPRDRRHRQLDHQDRHHAGGIRTVAVDPTIVQGNPAAVDFFYDTTAEATDLWSRSRPLPVDSTGDRGQRHLQRTPLGFSLETQTRPVYSAVRRRARSRTSWRTSVGDSVSRRLRHICSTRSPPPVRLAEHQGGRRRTTSSSPSSTASRRTTRSGDRDRRSAARHDVRPRGLPARGDDAPSAQDKIGATGSPGAQDWTAEHRHGLGTTAQFIALSERISRQDLDHFFDVWVYSPGKPKSW